MIFYYSDPHFFHRNIMTFCDRPFGSVAEMNRVLLDKYNRKVGEEDTVYFLGDLFYRCGKPNGEAEILSRMKGKKVLILGNHDESWIHKVDLSLYFEQVVEDELEIMDQGTRIALSHYPLFDEAYIRDGGYMVYGHLHNNGPNMPEWPELCRRERMLNCCVEVIGYEPCALAELRDRNAAFRALHPYLP